MLLIRKNIRDLWLNPKEIALIVCLITLVVGECYGERLYLVNFRDSVLQRSRQLHASDGQIVFAATHVCEVSSTDSPHLSVFENSDAVAAYSLRLVEPAQITVKGKMHEALLAYYDMRNAGPVNLFETLPKSELSEDDVVSKQVLIDERFGGLNEISAGERVTINKSGETEERTVKGTFVSPEYPISSTGPDHLRAVAGSLAIVVIPTVSSSSDSGFYNHVDVILNNQRTSEETLAELKQEMEQDGFQLLEVITREEQSNNRITKSHEEGLSSRLLYFGVIAGLAVILTLCLIAYRMLHIRRVEVAMLRGLGVTWLRLILLQAFSGLLVGAAGAACGVLLAVNVAKAAAKSYRSDYGFPELLITLHQAVIVEGIMMALVMSVAGFVLPLLYFIGKTPKCIELGGESHSFFRLPKRSSSVNAIRFWGGV